MIVDGAVYRHGERQPGPAVIEDVCGSARSGSFGWIGLHEPTEDELGRIGRGFGLHHLLLEDMEKAHQRAKCEFYDEATFVVLKSAHYVAPDRVEIGELQVILGTDFVVTARHGRHPPLGSVRRRLEADPGLLAHGPAAVLYAIADHTVDGYAPVVTALEVDIDEAEEDVFSDRRANHAARVYLLKRQVLELRRNIAPVGEVLDELRGSDSRVVPDDLGHYFRDVADHAHRVLGRVEVLRELLTDVLNANLAQVSVHQNDDMRRISAWAAVFAAPTLMAGIWGMNFRHMPELDDVIGYPAALTSMVVVSGALWWLFRRVGWL